jgi:hypothetical protein
MNVWTALLGLLPALPQALPLAERTVHGQVHRPVGEASLVVEEVDGHESLVVEGLGRSGSDGVEISLSPAEQVRLQLGNTLDPAPTLTPARFQILSAGQMLLRLEAFQGGLQVVDVGLYQSVEGLRGGEVVFREPASSLLVQGALPPGTWIAIGASAAGDGHKNEIVIESWSWGETTPASGPPVEIDGLRFTLKQPLQLGADPTIQVLSSFGSTLRIDREFLSIGGNLISATGQAQIGGQGRDILFGGMGQDSLDGAAIPLYPARGRVEVGFEPLMAGTLDLSIVELDHSGPSSVSLDGSFNLVFVSERYARIDFSDCLPSLGVPRVELLRDGIEVAEFVPGAELTLDAGPEGAILLEYLILGTVQGAGTGSDLLELELVFRDEVEAVLQTQGSEPVVAGFSSLTICFAGLEIPPGSEAMLGIRPQVKEGGGFVLTQVDHFATEPTLQLRVNGSHPLPPVVGTDGDLTLGLDLDPRGYSGSIELYLWAHLGGSDHIPEVYLLTRKKVSPSRQPYYSGHLVQLHDQPVFSAQLPPGESVRFVAALVGDQEVIASDSITAISQN